MATPAEHVAILKGAYRRWEESKGTDTKVWTDLFADKMRFQSLGAGAPGLEFTLECCSKAELGRYFDGLAQEYEMINYKPGHFIAEGDRVAMLGSTSWRHRKTNRVFDTPKADFFKFKDGRIEEFFELYDTAMVLATR